MLEPNHSLYHLTCLNRLGQALRCLLTKTWHSWKQFVAELMPSQCYRYCLWCDTYSYFFEDLTFAILFWHLLFTDFTVLRHTVRSAILYILHGGWLYLSHSCIVSEWFKTTIRVYTVRHLGGMGTRRESLRPRRDLALEMWSRRQIRHTLCIDEIAVVKIIFMFISCFTACYDFVTTINGDRDGWIDSFC